MGRRFNVAGGCFWACATNVMGDAMNEQLKAFAEEAGCFETMFELKELMDGENELKQFAKLVHQAAMEEAAKICDELNYNGITPLGCAAAIRNRAEEYLQND